MAAAAATPVATAPEALAEARWRALGTGVHLVVLDAGIEPARAAVEALLADVDATYSRFRPDSELMRAQAAAGMEVAVSPLLARAIVAALRGARLTDGLVDPTVGRALRAIGYDADFERVARRGAADDPAPVRLESIPGWRALRFDAAARTVRIPRGVELDLGSTGKALAADLAAEAALRAVPPGGGVLVSLGGDIALAGRAPQGGWRILAAESSEADPASDGEVVAMESGALATSSTTVRRWRRGEVEMHHLVDPRTGAPAEGPWRTVSVVAATCVDANIAASAAIIRGADALEWLAGTGLPARLVATSGEVVRVGGWPEPAASEAAEDATSSARDA